MAGQSNEMVERVARRLCELDGEDPDREIIGGQAQAFENYGPAWSAGGRCLGFPDYAAQARAAIEAMRAAVLTALSDAALQEKQG
jgi:hypothetical protein